jgi:hypothetical protein
MFEFVFTTKHGLWLNIIENLLEKFIRACLKDIKTSSKDELIKRIYHYLDEINEYYVVRRLKCEMDEIEV